MVVCQPSLADNSTASILNYTLELGNESVLITYYSGFTCVWGEVINVTFMPPFDVDLGVVRCNVQPFTTPNLETTKYQMVCDFEWNITQEQVYVPIPISMLKTFETMKGADRELASARAQLTVWRAAALIAIMVGGIYILYNEWWVYRD